MFARKPHGGSAARAGISYDDLHDMVRTSLDAAHVEGALKQEIAASPDHFVVLDEELPLALRDMKKAGKKLMIITNSDWPFANAMMSHSFDRFCCKSGGRPLSAPFGKRPPISIAQ